MSEGVHTLLFVALVVIIILLIINIWQSVSIRRMQIESIIESMKANDFIPLTLARTSGTGTSGITDPTIASTPKERLLNQLKSILPEDAWLAKWDSIPDSFREKLAASEIDFTLPAVDTDGNKYLFFTRDGSSIRIALKKDLD